MDYTEETFDKVMDLNVKGVFNTTRVAALTRIPIGPSSLANDTVNPFTANFDAG